MQKKKKRGQGVMFTQASEEALRYILKTRPTARVTRSAAN